MTNPTPYYDPNTPLVNTTYADWQINFLNNFNRLSTAFAVNHVPLEAASNAGNHNYIDFITRGQDPQTSLSEFSVYGAQDANDITQLFMSLQNNVKFQYTAYQIYPIEPQIPTQTSYFTILPGSMIVIFGQVNCAGNTLFDMPLFPAVIKSNGLISMNVTPVGTGVSGQQPFLTVLTNPQGFIQTMHIASNGLPNSGSNPLQNYYYMIVGNI